MRLGTVTLTGDFPAEIDGLVLPDVRRTVRFALTDAGLERKGKLWKTLDPALLAEALGVRNTKTSVHFKLPDGGMQ